MGYTDQELCSMKLIDKNVFFNRKIKFKSPPQSDILVFERIGSQRIRDHILPDLPFYVFDSRLEEIFISARLLLYFLENMKHIGIQDLKNVRRIPHAIIGQLWRIYLLSCIRCFRPKVVVTWIDNHAVFHWLCKHYKEAEFMAIQNGSRTRVEFKGLNVPYRIGHLFCFGEYEKDMYSGGGHQIDHYYPIGSVLGGYYKYRTNRKSTSQYDICVVSAWRGNIGNGPDVQRTMESMQKMDFFLSQYVKEYNLKVAIIMRSEPNSADRNIPAYGDEKEYFRNIYPDHVELIDPVFKEHNIYSVMDQSDFIVSFGSTAPREAFGWGKKVLFCDFTGTNLYNDYDPLILFRTENYDLLKTRLNEIRLMPYEDYISNTKDYASYLMNYDPNCPPHLFIRQKIEHYLS